MEEKTPTERVRTMLDEQGVEYHECKANECVSFDFGYCPQCDDYRKEIIVAGEYIEVAQKYLSPEQAIAATVEPNKTAEWRSVSLGLFGSLENADLETAKQWIAGNELLREELAYGEAKAATVDSEREYVATREQESTICDFLRKISPDRGWTYIGEVEHAWISEVVGALAATVGGKPKDNPQNYKPNGETVSADTCEMDETETIECVGDGIGHYGKPYTIHVMECSKCGRTYEHVNGDYPRCQYCGRFVEGKSE